MGFKVECQRSEAIKSKFKNNHIDLFLKFLLYFTNKLKKNSHIAFLIGSKGQALCVQFGNHSLTQSLTHSLIDSMTHLLTHSLMKPAKGPELDVTLLLRKRSTIAKLNVKQHSKSSVFVIHC